ncbi:hypothetical protein [Hydrogenophaga sp. NFH-34]|uniref:hypothetical protein n=1 Tax=Hydrogenophaga sp. NFH-34 TaxID=2744446 RepID=UPI001F424339|nr:hypothetical protein [Hydrogenophaga sp. NFH-34]
MSKVVHLDHKGNAIVARLNWSPINGTRRSHIRDSATSRGTGARRYVIYKPDEAMYIGLESDDVMAEVPVKAKSRHSFALLCLEHLLCNEADELSASNGIFVLSIEEEKDQDRRAICIIRNGAIVHDSVENGDRALNIAQTQFQEMGGYCLVFSDHSDVPIQQVETIEWGHLAKHESKATSLSPVPISPLVPLGIAAVLLFIGCGFAYHQMIHIPKKEAERAKRMAEADKTPQYLQALRQAADSLGWERGALIDLIDSMKGRVYFHDGWSLSEVTCTTSKCTEKWEREGGTLADLLKMQAGSTLVPDPKLSTKVAQLEWSIASKPTSLDLNNLPRGDLEKQLSYKPVLQMLDNAGISTNIGTPRAWPNFDVRNVKKKDVIVKAEKFEVRTIYPFGSDSIRELPSNVIFNGFTLKAVSPKSFVLVVEGAGYVR